MLRFATPLLMLAACVPVTDGDATGPVRPFGFVAEVPPGAARYLPEGTRARDLRVRDGCLYRRSPDGFVPVLRGRVELLCNISAEPVPAPGTATAAAAAPAAAEG